MSTSFSACGIGIELAEFYSVLFSVAFQDEQILFKALVYSIYAVETAQVSLITHDAYVTYVTGFGRLEALDKMHTIGLSVPIMTGIGKSLHHVCKFSWLISK